MHRSVGNSPPYLCTRPSVCLNSKRINAKDSNFMTMEPNSLCRLVTFWLCAALSLFRSCHGMLRRRAAAESKWYLYCWSFKFLHTVSFVFVAMKGVVSRDLRCCPIQYACCSSWDGRSKPSHTGHLDAAEIVEMRHLSDVAAASQTLLPKLSNWVRLLHHSAEVFSAAAIISVVFCEMNNCNTWAVSVIREEMK